MISPYNTNDKTLFIDNIVCWMGKTHRHTAVQTDLFLMRPKINLLQKK